MSVPVRDVNDTAVELLSATALVDIEPSVELLVEDTSVGCGFEDNAAELPLDV